MKYGIIASFSLVLFAVITPTIAQTKIEIDYETLAFEDRIISSGLVEISLSYQPFDYERDEDLSDYEINGILAGYVAQKILLGEYEQGWNFMLAHYDPTSDWGLGIYQDGKEIDRYPDFPTALKAFLIESGYLNENGQPMP